MFEIIYYNRGSAKLCFSFGKKRPSEQNPKTIHLIDWSPSGFWVVMLL